MAEAKGIDIIKELGLEDLPEDQKEELLAGLTSSLQSRITVRVMDVLTPEEKAEFEKILDESDDDKAGQFVAEKVPGLDAIAYDELQKMREELLAINSNIKEAVKAKNKTNSQ